MRVSDTCLGAVIDSQLTLADNVTKLAGCCFCQLRQLQTVLRSVTTDTATTLVHAWTIATVSCMASMKSTFVRFSRYYMQRRDSSPVKESLINDHITSTMRHHDLHWLPVRQRIVSRQMSPPCYTILSDRSLYSGIGDNRSLMSTFVRAHVVI